MNHGFPLYLQIDLLTSEGNNEDASPLKRNLNSTDRLIDEIDSHYKKLMSHKEGESNLLY